MYLMGNFLSYGKGKEIMKIIKISVRNLVEFLLRSGDIDNRVHHAPDTAMQEGSKIHRMIQKSMGAEYQAEVPLSYTKDTDKYRLIIDGRADGVMKTAGGVLIDEIKGTYRDLNKLKNADEVHMAQALVYGAIYVIDEELEEINIRITYCNIDTLEKKYFEKLYQRDEIIRWFDVLLNKYDRWATYITLWEEKRDRSIKKVNFPYPYREGQKELAADVYRTIYHNRKLFLEAPTGTGKTLTTVFPSVKAIGEKKAERIFYLTAKTITRTVAEDAFETLRNREGLIFKTSTITAKEKVCLQGKCECNPAACSLAHGHYDRINDCIYDFLTHEDNCVRDKIFEYAQKHNVCPFEMTLDMSLFADAIICDYNYVFDPFVYLKRFFAEGRIGNNIFLVDEAHNLLDRGRKMYSAELYLDELINFREDIEIQHRKIASLVKKAESEYEKVAAKGYKAEVLTDIPGLISSIERLISVISSWLEDHAEGEKREEILDFYFKISEFASIYELVNDKYVIYSDYDEEDHVRIRLLCVDPSENLALCMARARSSILFSATLLPIQYYKKLLGGTGDDYEVYAHSVFDPKRCQRLISRDVTSKYTRRNDTEYYKIASYISDIVKAKSGNYMIFFPSRLFMDDVGIVYEQEFFDQDSEEILVQKEGMTEEDRESFLGRFTPGNDIDFSKVINMDIQVEKSKSILGFCVMGGIFSEGIDLKDDSLIGVIIVGTGIPMICNENEIIKEYFDDNDEDGFDYAYRYPGINKVLQAAGRVIRTERDYGIVALLDERFMQKSYYELFPREWKGIKLTSTESVKNDVKALWERIDNKYKA